MRNILLLTLIGISCVAADKPTTGDYSNNFEQAELGKPADEFLILNGAFAVVQVEGNKSLELTADPLDGDGFLFGPPGMVTGTVGARIWASANGKQFPEFGIGSNDAGGFKLIAVPSQGVIELRKGDDAVASAAYAWKSDTWTRFRIHIAKTADGRFQIEGKVWPDGSPEPKAWMVSTQETEAPSAGRASAWGMAYAGKPIRFDDLSFEPG